MVSPSAAAYTPTAAEWATWPPYCRAKYTATDLIRDTEFQGQVSAEEIEHWQIVLGPAFASVHHYCYALVSFGKAMTATSKADRVFHLGDALGDAKFTLDRIKMTDAFAPDAVALYAQIQFELGHAEQAEAALTQVMNAQPESDRPYLILSSIMRQKGDVSGAMNLLEKGNSMTHLKSAEINYALGLMYFDRHDYKSARECAARAYALGYPLPGLNNKLKRVGQ
jgi:tetratricopeptide (TPR) repeat protein